MVIWRVKRENKRKVRLLVKNQNHLGIVAPPRKSESKEQWWKDEKVKRILNRGISEGRQKKRGNNPPKNQQKKPWLPLNHEKREGTKEEPNAAESGAIWRGDAANNPGLGHEDEWECQASLTKAGTLCPGGTGLGWEISKRGTTRDKNENKAKSEITLNELRSRK